MLSQNLIADFTNIYTDRSVRTIPHRFRLWLVKRKVVGHNAVSHADFGCADGFITAEIAAKLGSCRTIGFGYDDNELELARKRYPHLEFRQFNMTKPDDMRENFDLVTCFETLEHVSDLRLAVETLVRATRPGGNLILSVPVERGLVGALKFVLKNILLQAEVKRTLDGQQWGYFQAIVRGERLSRFRSPLRGEYEWRQHFGFDYRDLDDALRFMGVMFRAENWLTTRIYLCTVPPEALDIVNRKAMEPGSAS